MKLRTRHPNKGQVFKISSNVGNEDKELATLERPFQPLLQVLENLRYPPNSCRYPSDAYNA